MISHEQLKQILVEQREKLLKRPFGIDREVLKEIEKKANLPHIRVITGIRRSGKSTLLRQIIKKFYYDQDFYYISFEDERLFNFPVNEFNRIYETLVSVFGDKKTFFIDEIQNIPHFEAFVRRFYEDGFKFFITGSSANLLSRELGTKLTGRHIDILVSPFSFKEFLKLKEYNLTEKSLYTTEERVLIKKYFDEYLIVGGMPEYALYGDSETLAKIYEDIVLKDIVVRRKVRNLAELRELYQYLITTVGSTFSYHSLKKIISIRNVSTIKKYIEYLKETYFATTINKFDYALKKQLVNDKKFYVVDNGFISILAKKLSPDQGWLLENLVYNTLAHGENVFYYAGKHECDFLVVEQKKVQQAIQVCYELNAENKEREINGLLEAMEHFMLTEGICLTHEQEEELQRDGKKINILPVWKWLLRKNAQV